MKTTDITDITDHSGRITARTGRSRARAAKFFGEFLVYASRVAWGYYWGYLKNWSLRTAMITAIAINPVVPQIGITELTGLQERFAQFVAAGNSASKAYRLSTDTSAMAPATVSSKAYALAHTPQVAERIKALRAAIAERFVADEAAIRAALHHRQYQIAFAPALVQVRVFCCRYCNLTYNRFQSRGADEYHRAI